MPPRASAPRTGSPIYRGPRPGRGRASSSSGCTPPAPSRIGKTNVPEFGAGSQTFNTVFGTTLNPYDLDQDLRRLQRRRGGRARQRHAADRRRQRPRRLAAQPGGFCNVVGFRPSPGRVPMWPTRRRLVRHDRRGPDGAHGRRRGAADERHRRARSARAASPSTSPATRSRRPLDRDFRGVRVAWSRDLGGLPVDPRITGGARCAARRRSPRSAASSRTAEPDFTGADEVFQVCRALGLRAQVRRAAG